MIPPVGEKLVRVAMGATVRQIDPVRLQPAANQLKPSGGYEIDMALSV